MDPLLADIDPSVAEGDEEHRWVSSTPFGIPFGLPIQF